MKRDDDRVSVVDVVKGSILKHLKSDYPRYILVFVTFLVAVALSFVKISTSNSLVSFNVADYEIGQVSDINVVASKSLPATYEYPVSVEKGEKVIKKGFPITEEAYTKLKKMSESNLYLDYRTFANSIVFNLLICCLFFYLCSRQFFGEKRIEFKELITECSAYLLIFAATVFGMKAADFSSPFAIAAVIPSSLCVFLVTILFGHLNALFFSLVISFAVFDITSYQIVPFLFVLSTSFAATRVVKKIDRRSDLVFASMLQAVLNVVFLVIFILIFRGSIRDNVYALFAVALNGFFSGILCLGLLTPLEILLNTASLFRLMDLSDLNSPLMKKMLVTASGTYNHSLMVANLAEAACNEVQANALLARVGAYYHDIGKLENPEYFVENQSGENVHDGINPSLSVSIIRSHVKRGVEKALSLRLPASVVNIISEHHGNQVIAYFYNEAKKIDPDASAADYSYAGNPPTTRESAIVMLADTVEAACRTLDKPSVPRLEKFIKTLIDSKIEHHQLENCNLTFRDIAKIQESFVQTLAGYYHSRTKYPDQKDPDAPQQTSSPVEQTQNQGQNQTAQNEAPVQQKKAEEKISVSTAASASTAGVVIKKTRTTAAKTKAAPVKKVVKEAKQ